MQIYVALCIFVKLWNYGNCFKLSRDKDHDGQSELIMKHDVIQADISVHNVYQVLEKLAFYYYKHRKDVTIDYAFGLRIAEGEIHRILHMAEIGIYPLLAEDTKTMAILKKLMQTIQVNVKQSLPFIEKSNKESFNMFYPLLKEKWRSYEFAPRFTIRDISTFPDISNVMLLEKRSDTCMAQLMGTEGFDKCQINTCWDVMTAADKALYYNTHQILWLLLGDKMGCREALDERAKADGYKDGINDILKKKCATAVIEMESIVEDRVRHGLVDLFLEQGFICGSIGFMDAVRPSFLRLAFQWQDPSLGCFPETTVTEDEKREFKYWVDYKKEDWRSRHILTDTVMKDGCSTHTSGVGAAFFATYLRLFFDPIYKKNQLDPYLPSHEVVVSAPQRSWGIVFKVLISVVCLFALVLLELKKRFFRRAYAFTARKCLETFGRKFLRSASPI